MGWFAPAACKKNSHKLLSFPIIGTNVSLLQILFALFCLSEHKTFARETGPSNKFNPFNRTRIDSCSGVTALNPNTRKCIVSRNIPTVGKSILQELLSKKNHQICINYLFQDKNKIPELKIQALKYNLKAAVEDWYSSLKNLTANPIELEVIESTPKKSCPIDALYTATISKKNVELHKRLCGENSVIKNISDHTFRACAHRENKEIRIFPETKLAVIRHEVGHLMGLPDLYLEKHNFQCRSYFARSSMCQSRLPIQPIDRLAIKQQFCYLNPNKPQCQHYLPYSLEDTLRVQSHQFTYLPLMTCVQEGFKAEIHSGYTEFNHKTNIGWEGHFRIMTYLKGNLQSYENNQYWIRSLSLTTQHFVPVDNKESSVKYFPGGIAQVKKLDSTNQVPFEQGGISIDFKNNFVSFLNFFSPPYRTTLTIPLETNSTSSPHNICRITPEYKNTLFRYLKPN